MARQLTRTKPELTEENDGLEEFTPQRRRVTKEEDTSPVQAGWSVNRRMEINQGDRPTRFVVPDNGAEILIAFLEDKPFASFFQHWIPKKNGRAYTCREVDCPLCDRGDRPKPQDWFNVIRVYDPDEKVQALLPRLELWYCSADPAKAIKDKADKTRYSPLNKDHQYFAVSKHEASNGFPTYSVDYIDGASLNSDWGIEELTEEQVKPLLEKAHTSDLVRVQTKAELQEVADEHLGN